MKQIIKRLTTIRHRNAIRLALKRHPIEYRLRWPDLSMCNLSRRDIVFDVGANIGDFTECTLSYQPWAQIHAFEPVPKAFEKLTGKFGAYPDVYCRNIALGSWCGQKPINVSRFVEASSFLENGRLLDDKVYGIDFTVEETLPVSVETLSGYASANSIRRIKLLKLDVQGYELEVLKGAETFLHNIEFIYTEAQFQELYQHGPSYNDIFEFLSGKNFELIRMTAFRADDAGKLMECDMVFKNRNDNAHA